MRDVIIIRISKKYPDLRRDIAPWIIYKTTLSYGHSARIICTWGISRLLLNVARSSQLAT